MSALLESGHYILHCNLPFCFWFSSKFKLTFATYRFGNHHFQIKQRAWRKWTLIHLIHFSRIPNRCWLILKQMRRGAERAEEECREWWRQVPGAMQGWSAQEEAQAQPHHLHHLPAAWAGTCLWEVPLPRCVQPRGARYEGEPPRGPSPGGRTHNITGNNMSLSKPRL